ncbi:hypothetical protein V2J09_019032 [Rumex salicifolius]
MNSSIFTTSSPSPNPPLLFSSFLPPTSLSLNLSSALPKRRRYRVSSLRCSSSIAEHPVSAASPPPSQPPVPADVFGGRRELTGIQSVAGSLSPPVRLAGSVVVVAAALAAGYGLGLRIGRNQNAAYGGALALGAAAGGAAYALNSCVPEVAAANLHNFVADCEDPLALTKEDIDGIAKKYGVSKLDETFNAELCDLYCRFVSSVLPEGSENLKGDEVETIVKFKNALGIDDPEAANMHIEIGRRIFRQRLETGDRDDDAQQRRAFQKLVYVSTLVFGDASTFLLPWKRVFRVTDSQLVSLRQFQLAYRLSDELAEDMFRVHMRKLAEANISTAVDILKSRTGAVRGKEIMDELNKILAFNNHLLSLANHSDAGKLARGIGQVSLNGGEFDTGRRIDELKSLYRAYVVDSLSSGRMEENRVTALNQLRTIFGLGKRESEAIMLDVTSKLYRKQLAQAFSGGELEAADSKASFLQNLCDRLRFDPEKASGIHEEIYRQKLQQFVADGKLSDEDVAALLRVRVMLCIPQKTVEAAHAEICGRLFEKVVNDAISSGVDGYDADVKANVRKAAHGLRLTGEVAISLASKAVRRIFITYIRQARAASNRTESAKVLKKMIAFNTLVATELVADIKGESTDSTDNETIKEEKTIPKEEEEEEEEEWDSIQTLRKTRPGSELDGKLAKPGQTEITLKDDLPVNERKDLYKTYLLYCLTGDVVKIPFGAQIATKKDDREYLYLNQLGGILGLTRSETVDVHRGLAEESFRKQAEVMLADGQLTKARIEQLNELQKEVGLPPEYAQKVMKNITSSKMASAIETAIQQGRLSLKQVRELKEASVSLDSMISESLRENLYKKTVDEIFSAGTGEFDEEEVYEKIPADLNINSQKARATVFEIARTRLSDALVQAVALLRQRKHSEVVSTLNNMLACDKAVPATPLSWDVPDELADLFAIYLASEPSSEKTSRLQYLLDISDSTAEVLKQRGFKLQEESKEEDFEF